MAVTYKLMKDTRESSAYKGQYYAKAVHTDTIDLSALADRIQRNCSMKKSDCYAVLTELVEVMKDELQASHIVKVDGLGSFKIGIKGTFCETAKDFNASTNITGYRVNFRPTYTTIKTGTTVDPTTGETKVKKANVVDLTNGITAQEY